MMFGSRPSLSDSAQPEYWEMPGHQHKWLKNKQMSMGKQSA
jgi:hypothetical protein